MIVCPVLLLAAVLFVYGPCLHGTLVWDDDAHLTRPALRSLEGLGQIWAEPGATQQYYPVLHTAFWVEYRLFGDDPFGYHLVNLGLHGAAAILLALVLRRWGVRGGWIAATLFAVHPVMVESTAWISEQKNTLSAVLGLVAVLSYLRFDASRRTRWYFFALAWFLAALGAKTVVATLPGALLVGIWWRRGELRWRRDILPLVPFLAAGAIAGLFTGYVERALIGATGPAYALSGPQRLLLPAHILWFYVGKLVWPSALAFSYPRWEISPADPTAYAYVTALVAILLAAAWWATRRSSRGPLALALIYAGVLFPVLGFLNVYPFRFSFVADHFQYLATMAVCAGAGWLIWRITSVPIRMAATALLVVPLALCSHRQCAEYQSENALYRATLARNPSSWLAAINLGRVLHTTGHYDEAIAWYSHAAALQPNDPLVFFDRGTAYAAQRRFREAAADLERAVALRPTDAKAHHNLGLAYSALGDAPRAERQFVIASALQPADPEPRRSLTLIYLRSQRFAAAARQLEKIVRIAPDDQLAVETLARLRSNGVAPAP